ncbi:Adhesion G protein-coupled receptor L3 [Halotydeus destructor]|nr:Adhesion G protein-coupled receptor L3 [Halotydeus destructor]
MVTTPSAETKGAISPDTNAATLSPMSDYCETADERECPPDKEGNVLKCYNYQGSFIFYTYRNCTQKWFGGIRASIRDERPADEITSNVTAKLQQSNGTTAGDLDQVLEVTDKIKGLFRRQISNVSKSECEPQAKLFTRKMVQCYSAILDDTKTEAWLQFPENSRSSAAQKVLVSLQDTAFSLGCYQESDHVIISAQHIRLETFLLDDNHLHPNFSFPAIPVSGVSRVSFTSFINLTRSRCSDKYIVSGAIYKKLGNHLVAAYSPELRGRSDKKLINSNVVSFSLDSESSLQLPNETKVRVVIYHHQLRRYGERPMCSYWDFEIEDWSHNGCRVVEEESYLNQTTCECGHLTNFAILMDISGREPIENGLKNILTIVCCSLSAVSLAATLILIATVKEMRNRRTIITANLSVCLLVVNLLIIFGLDQTENTTVCRTISGVLLFSLLSAFGWMLLEGYCLYQMVILVFRSSGFIETYWFYLVAYIPSFTITLIYLCILGPEGLFNSDYGFFCWISNRYQPYNIWAFTGPALCVVFLNIIILILSFKEALKAKRRKPANAIYEPSENTRANLTAIKKWLKGWTSLTILLGATWVFGLLYIHESVSWFSYVFIVLNGLQGVFIFLFEVVLNNNARAALMKNLHGKLSSNTVSKTTSNLTIRTKSTSSERVSVSAPNFLMRKKASNDISMDPAPSTRTLRSSRTHTVQATVNILTD